MTMMINFVQGNLKLRGVPPQGENFFKVYYTIFRGRGVIFNGKAEIFTYLLSFFTATSVLYIGCENTGSHVEAAVNSSTVMSMEAALCGFANIPPMWSPALTRSLASRTDKDPSKFRILIDGDEKRRDRDLVVHTIDIPFPPAPTADSVKRLKEFINQVQVASARLVLGGFYVLASPSTNNGIDMLLSGITATGSSLIYVGMMLYSGGTEEKEWLLWVFRMEPMHPGALDSQRSLALARLSRYPPMLQEVVIAATPPSSEVGLTAPHEEVLGTRVTPTATLGNLFRVAAGPYPREILNMLSEFQPKYSTVIDRVKILTDPKIQVKMITELLYDLGLSVYRRCAAKS